MIVMQRRWLTGPLMLAAGIVAAAFLMAGCGGAVSSAIGNAASKRLMSFEAALRALRAPDQRLPY